MNKLKIFSVVFLFYINESLCFSQTVSRRSSFVATTTFSNNLPAIYFTWDTIYGATANDNLFIEKKTITSTTWIPFDTISAVLKSYTDTNIVAGVLYEYKFYVPGISGGMPINSICTGIEMPPVENRGKLLLLIDTSFVDSLQSEINRLQKDITGDGWRVVTRFINSSSSVINTKNIIVNEYLLDSTNLKSVLLLGHIPVPYSGNMAPDGHVDHYGAWPADVYYADINGTWTDNTINSTIATRSQNHNTPGDGKFDQNIIPTKAELVIGRVDLSNLPAFGLSDVQLMRRYLNKNHDYRVKNIVVNQRGLIDDNFGSLAQTGWRGFSALFGKNNVHELDYFTTLQTQSYIWSYGCGPGTYSSASGIGNTNDFVTKSCNTIFSALYGSYFGDWDVSDNFLRASLASSGLTLATMWGGDPIWSIQHMGMGYTIGEITRLNQNISNGWYNVLPSGSAKSVYISLMGDPSLRLHVISPPDSLTASLLVNSTVKVSWKLSNDTVLGYHIYRLDTITGYYQRINTSIVISNSYVDSSPINGNNYYMVRAINLEDRSSGSYYNLSQGIFDTIFVINTTGIVQDKKSNISINIYPNPMHDKCSVEILTYGLSEKIEVDIFDASGKQVYSSQLNNGQCDYILSLESLSPGIYMAKFSTIASTELKIISIIR